MPILPLIRYSCDIISSIKYLGRMLTNSRAYNHIFFPPKSSQQMGRILTRRMEHRKCEKPVHINPIQKPDPTTFPDRCQIWHPTIQLHLSSRRYWLWSGLKYYNHIEVYGLVSKAGKLLAVAHMRTIFATKKTVRYLYPRKCVFLTGDRKQNDWQLACN